MRIYNRSFRAEDANGTPLAGAQVTLWDAKTGGTQLTDGIQDLNGGTIAGGILTTDTWGYLPDFADAMDRDDVWAIGSLTGTITGVERVLLESSSDDGRITALESFTSGSGGLDERLTGVEDSRGQPSGIATLDEDGLVPAEQLPEIDSGGGGSTAALNVIDYGATGDGTTNDAAAIQAALDDVAASHVGARVMFPPGTYLISSELEIKSSVWLDLTPGATIKRGSTSMQYMIRNFNSSYAPTGYTGRGGIRITGGVWDADGGNLTGSVTVIIVAHAKRVRIEGVTVRNVRDWHAVELNSTQDGIVRDCTFEGFKPVASNRQISEAVQIDLAIDSAALPGIGAGAYDNTPCDGILVTGCTARALGSLGSFGRLVGSHSFIDTVFHKKIRIVGNHAEALNDYMVRGYNWIDATVTGNTCTDSNGGVRFEVPTGATAGGESIDVTGNTFRSMGTQNGGASVVSAVISIAGLTTPSSVPIREATVTANIIKTFANAAAIEVINTADIITTGNVIKSGSASGCKGIDSVSCANAVITGNKVDTVAYGVHSREANSVSGAGGTIEGNLLATCSTTGAQIDTTSTFFVANRVRACGDSTHSSVEITATYWTVVSNYIWKSSGSGKAGLHNSSAAGGGFVAANTWRGWLSSTGGTSGAYPTGAQFQAVVHLDDVATTPAGDSPTTYSSTEKYISSTNN
jgi:hypothetical protein